MALFGAKNGIFGPQRPPWRPPCDDFKTKTLPIWCPVMMVTKNLEYVPIIWLWGQKTLYFWPKNQFFSTLRPYNPLFWPQTDPAQWDHIFPISSGNSGYLRFSGRCPFGRSAGRFLAPIAQKWPFLGWKCYFFYAMPI